MKIVFIFIESIGYIYFFTTNIMLVTLGKSLLFRALSCECWTFIEPVSYVNLKEEKRSLKEEKSQKRNHHYQKLWT